MRSLLALLLLALVSALATVSFAAGAEDTWKITAPRHNANVTGPEVTLTVDPGQVKVVPPGPVAVGEGHWHFIVDDVEVQKAATNTFVYKGLSAGTHVLKVELHKGDHTIYGTGQQVTINVSLPNTAMQLTLYVLGGVVILGAGGYFFTRRTVVRV